MKISLSSNSRNNCTNPVLSQPTHTRTQMREKIQYRYLTLITYPTRNMLHIHMLSLWPLCVEVNDLRRLKHQRTCFNQTHSCVWNKERSISMLIQMICSSTISTELNSIGFIVFHCNYDDCGLCSCVRKAPDSLHLSSIQMALSIQ